MKDARSQSSESDLKPGLTALNWAVSHELAEQVAAESRVKSRRIRRRRIAGRALAMVGVAAVLAFALRSQWSAPATIPVPASALVALPAKQVLPDGTIVELRDDAAIVSEMTPGSASRRVKLVRGEAHFEVSHDAVRSFVVSANGVEVRAVGTAFAVALGTGTVEVVVTEGKVALEKHRDASANSPVVISSEVSAGQRLAVAAAGATGVLSATALQPDALAEAELAERLAWRIPRIELSSTPLSEAIPLYNRYSRTRLVLSDPSLGKLQLSGVLRPDSTASLLHLLKVEFNIVATPRGENEIVLSRD